MVALFGHAWTSVHGVSPQAEAGGLTLSGDTWAKALAGITPAQLAAGLQACIVDGCEFPPAAGRFRAMCLGIPILARVRYELQPGRKRCAFTRLVWQFVDATRLAELPADKQDRHVRDAYDLAHEHLMRGGELPAEPVAALEHQSDAAANRWGMPEKPVDPSSPQARRFIEELARDWGMSEPATEEEAAPVVGKMAAAGPDA